MNNKMSQMMSMLRGFRSGNPQQIMQSIMSQNPNFNQTLKQMQNMANGRSPKELFMQVAKQNGFSEADINEMINTINNH